MKYLKKYEKFENVDSSKNLKTKSNIISFDYEAIKKNVKNKPILYVIKYEIIKDDGNNITCKIKGYQYINIKIKDKIKKGWVKINDFIANNRTHTLHKKEFITGTAKRKIYDIIL
jgi:hypothetical protein